MLKRIFVLFALLGPVLSQGQNSFIDLERNLSFHADVMVNASKAEHRMKSGIDFHMLFKSSLEQENSFNYPFDSLIWISKMEASDQTFRIFTWQIVDSKDVCAYHGFVQLENGSLFELTDLSEDDEDLEFMILGVDNWLGQLYYDILTENIKGEKLHFLFGYRKNKDGSKTKVFERISIDENRVVFGAEEFFKEGERHGKCRILLNYASVANASINYDQELDIVMYDHLIPVINPYEKNEMMMVPGGTYEGYEFKKGKWQYKDRIFNQVYEKAPVPEPIKRDKNKDLFGRTKEK